MKKQLPAFLTGFLAAVLILSLSLSSFAAITGKTTIEVGPISIMVKGEIFQPTDVNGNPVDVFVYKGTTYAPLRALAEAYGLEVSYDGEAKMAVVEEPDMQPSQQPDKYGVPDYSTWSEEENTNYKEFLDLWDISGPKYITDAGDEPYNAYQFQIKNKDITKDDVIAQFPNITEYCRRFLIEAYGTSEAALIYCIAGDQSWYPWKMI